MCGASNHYYLDVAIFKNNCEGGIDEELFFSHSENSDKILPTPDDWILCGQYDVVIACMKQYFEGYQSSQVFFHLYLWWRQVNLEQLNAPFFSMENSILIAVDAHGIDITKPCFNRLVKW